MILTCAFSPEIAGGLFRFKKDHAQYSLKPEDYVNKPLFLASKENRFHLRCHRAARFASAPPLRRCHTVRGALNFCGDLNI